MVLSDHGNYSGVVDIARNGIDEVIRPLGHGAVLQLRATVFSR